MIRRAMQAAVAVSLITMITACAATLDVEPEGSRAPTSSVSIPTGAGSEPTPSTSTPVEASEDVVGTVVRFTSERIAIDVTIGEDSDAVRDFLAMLPLQVPFEEFAGREKIAYLPRELNAAGSPGSDPENGDLIYYVPWGNIGFYYNADGIGFSEATVHLGTYNATEEQLSLLEGDSVTIEIVG